MTPRLWFTLAVASAVLALGQHAAVRAQLSPAPKVCPFLHHAVPSAVIADALAQPDKVYGWNKRANPNALPSPYNTPRTWLSLRTPGARYHPLYNGLLFVSGCPVAADPATVAPPPPTDTPTVPPPPPTTPPTTPTPVPPPVVLVTPTDALFVGSYVEVPIHIAPSAGLTAADLDVVVPDGPAAGRVSRSEVPGAAGPSFMLLVGHEPGSYPILATLQGTGTVVATAHFTSTATWNDVDDGPGLWLEAVSEAAPSQPAAVTPADPAAAHASHAAAAPANPRLLIVIADTSSNRFTGSQGADAVARWEDEARDGVSVGGIVRSTRAYYEELTGGAVDLDVEVRGPVALPGSWTTYYEDYTATDSRQVPRWSNLYAACVDAVDDAVDFNDVFSLACVTKSASGALFAWPFAATLTLVTDEGNLPRGVIAMPEEWPTLSGSGGRARHVTLAHEFGHNLGLPDEYHVAGTHEAGLAARDPDDWTLMSREDDLPHVTVPERRWLATTPASAIRTFDYGGATAPFVDTVELHPAELASPPAGRATGVEIRKAAGWSYWCEYRVGQTSQTGDRSLPTNDRVLCTDVMPSPPADRRRIVLLSPDTSGDGSVLGNLQEYSDVDPDNPDATLKLSVSAMDGSKARLQVEYGPRGRPDPSIRPWPAGPGRRWQSADIEVKNARNQASPAFFNLPWAGHDNEIHATLHNLGTIDATAVEVEFYIKDFNAGGSPAATFLGATTATIPAGGSTVVPSPVVWQPAAEGHYCVVVRILPYSKAVGGFSVAELTGTNNEAQSNYDDFISASASPASRAVTSIVVRNPYTATTVIALAIDPSRSDFRTYLEHSWLRLAPGESRAVRAMFESTRDVPLEDPDRQRWAANQISITASILDPLDDRADHAGVLGGADVRVRHGWATRFVDLAVEGTRSAGRVVRANGQPVPGGWVIVEATEQRGGAVVRTSATAVVGANGAFNATLPSPNWESVQAFYVPVPGFADSQSERVTRP